MIDILTALRGGNIPRVNGGPGMQLASGNSPYVNDIGPVEDFSQEKFGLTDPNIGDPRTLSGRIQQALGAKPQNEQGMVGDILSQRFPTAEDSVNAITQTWADPHKAVTSQQIADERMNLAQKLQQRQSGGSVFSQTMEAINSDPATANLPLMTKLRLAQNKVGTNLMVDENGNVTDMAGAAQGLGNLSYGQKMGSQKAVLDTERAISKEGAIGKAEGEKQGVAGAALPSIEQNTAYSQNILKQLVNHPGLKYAQGFASYAPLIRGTDRADFESLRNQVGGSAFLQAFQALKGGGQISNIEGEKATQAITRIMDRSLSPEDFIAAANDLYNVLEIGLQRTKGEAQGNFNQSFTPQEFNNQNFGTGKTQNWVIKNGKLVPQ